jgi:hypothetical protein
MFSDFLRRSLAILVALSFSAATVHPIAALEKPAPLRPTEGTPAPPFTIGGWNYTLGPNNIHFYLCQRPACGPKSKVSWTPIRQAFSSLDEYKAARSFIVDTLRRRLPAGAEITAEEPQEKRIANVRVMSSVRHQTAADGIVSHIVSQAVMGPVANIDLISSSENLASAKANAALFLVPVLILVRGIEKPKQAPPQ